MQHDNRFSGLLHVVRVDPYSGDVFPVAENLSVGGATEIVWKNTKPGRDPFVALDAEGVVVISPPQKQSHTSE